MGTISYRFYFNFILIFLFIHNSKQNDLHFSGLYRYSYYPSIQFALKQVNRYFQTTTKNFQFLLNDTERIIDCDVGTGVKTLFDMYNHSSTRLRLLFTDTCQNVLSYIAEIGTYFRLPVISFIDTDLSLLAKDRYPYFIHLVPSDHAHNLVRKELLQNFNWTRFGLIYQHGSKYALVANDFSNLTVMDKIQFEVNLTRGLAYRHGLQWHDDNVRYMKNILQDFKDRDVRIIIANFNQTIAIEMFCQAAQAQVYGARYQWIILGYPSEAAWWDIPTDCSMQQIVRAMNGTLQTRVPRFSIEQYDNRTDEIFEYINRFAELQKDYFDAYAYDTIWSLAYVYQSQTLTTEQFKKAIDNIDFIGATGRVRYLDGGRIGEVHVEQFVACRPMTDGTCSIPCYEEEENCYLTIVKIFLAKQSEDKNEPPILYRMNPIMWHGIGPPRDRTNQTDVFEHISLSVFISISICSIIGLIISCSFFGFNVHFRAHRYIRMSSPSLNNLILGGCMLAYISIILMGINSSLFPRKFSVEFFMNIICPMRVWILCISFTLAFGSMFSKTWRVHSIFTNINMTKKGIHDSRLLAIVCILLIIDFIFLISWHLFDPVHRKLIYAIPYRLKSNPDIEIFPNREECKSKHMSLWIVVLVLYKGLLMFYGSFLSWKTRNVQVPALNDSRYIGLSVYIVFICCTLGSLVVFIPSEQIQLSYILQSFFIVVCTTTTVCLVFVPKVIEVYQDPYSRKKQPRVTHRFQTQTKIFTGEHLNIVIENNKELKLVLAMQEQTLNRLIDQLNSLDCSKNQCTKIEPVEFERLIVSDDEDDPNDDNHDISQPNRMSRAVSLCLFTKLPFFDSSNSSRYSIPSHDDHYRASSSKYLLQQTYQQNFKLIDIDEDIESTTSSNRIELIYDGLRSLDDVRLEQLIETDLISSTNV